MIAPPPCGEGLGWGCEPGGSNADTPSPYPLPARGRGSASSLTGLNVYEAYRRRGGTTSLNSSKLFHLGSSGAPPAGGR